MIGIGIPLHQLEKDLSITKELLSRGLISEDAAFQIIANLEDEIKLRVQQMFFAYWPKFVEDFLMKNQKKESQP